MANFEVIMPKMGESIEEATITKWFVKEGDPVEEEAVLLEIATDKVDSEIPSPVDGTIKKIFFAQDEVVAVGTVIAIIGTDEDSGAGQEEDPTDRTDTTEAVSETASVLKDGGDTGAASNLKSTPERFYSPLVRRIAKEEKVTQEELDRIPGSGLNNRVQKQDILAFLANRGDGGKAAPVPAPVSRPEVPASGPAPVQPTVPASAPVPSGDDEVIEMSRMRKLIAGHMIRSKQISAHVTNMLEVDVTPVVTWRERVKEEYQDREGVKITYLPVFLQATVRALREFPQINASVQDDHIILKRRINLGVAVSLPDNNLIVPNIKDADHLNLTGMAKKLNELAQKARTNKLSPDEISGGTFTVTNFGTFKNDIGTPIINQPEVAILAVGAIKKKPAVLETPDGDVIAIRQKMWLSLTYDHRIIDGALGGAFLKRLGDIIESFDPATGNFK